jgi:YHS domain-containing protein
VVRFILLFLLAMFVARAFWRLLAGVVEGAVGTGAPPPRGRGDASAVKMVKDPVCGTFVVPGKAVQLARAGETHWFCSERCRAEFAKR